MRRADRLFDIVQRLRGGRLVTARRLAEMLEVSDRTIYRDIADLMASGVPIEGEAGVGYILRSGYDLPPLMFNKAEAEAMMMGLRMAEAFTGARVAEAAREAIVKIEAVLPPDLRQQMSATPIHAHAPFLQDEDRARFDFLQTAIDRRLELLFDYRKEDASVTRRTIRPLTMTFWGRVWTLGAWCLLRNDFRVFRVDRMSGIGHGAVFPLERGKTAADFYRLARHERAKGE
jgi:predicted DNA-binding transcriptional regulator YafY